MVFQDTSPVVMGYYNQPFSRTKQTMHKRFDNQLHLAAIETVDTKNLTVFEKKTTSKKPAKENRPDLIN